MTPTSHEGDAEVEVLSVETGSLSSQEKAPEGSSEEQMPSPTHTDDGKASALFVTYTHILLRMLLVIPVMTGMMPLLNCILD